METCHFLCRIYKLINREKSLFFSPDNMFTTYLYAPLVVLYKHDNYLVHLMLKMYNIMPFNLLIGLTVRSKDDSRFFITVILHVCRNSRDTGSELSWISSPHDDMFTQNH